MINLLAPESQKRFRAARLNLKLRSYIFILLATLLGVVGIFGAGYYLTLSERAIAERKLQDYQQQTASYQGVRNEAKAFADNLKIAKSILSQEIVYSDLVTQIAQTLPSSAVLTALNVDATTIAKPMVLSGRVKTKNDALVLKSTLEASPLFENVSINNVTDAPEFDNPSSTQNRIIRSFPVTVTVSVTLSKKVAL